MTDNPNSQRVDDGSERHNQSTSLPRQAGEQDDRRKLESALGTLRHLDRQIFLAAYIDHMPTDEIARRTGLTLAQVEDRIARAIMAFDRVLCGAPSPWWKQFRRLRWWPF